MNYKKLILGRLLDKYEKSSSFKGSNSPRRIMIKMNRNEFPEYDIENTYIREAWNSTVRELSEQGIAEFSWLKYEKGNIIDKVWLNLFNIGQAYSMAGRKPKRQMLDTLLARIDEISVKISDKPEMNWIRRFIEDTRQSIISRAAVTGYLPSDEEQALAVLRALEVLGTSGDQQWLERVFSLRCFNDSKYFEKRVRVRLLGILRKYLPDEECQSEATDEEILAQAGILKAPEQIEFKGGIVGRIGCSRVDFSSFIYGVIINSDTVKDLTIEEIGDIRKVLFIENKANYIHFISQNNDKELMTVFHGGFYSPVRGLFFKKLYEAAFRHGVEFYHWSDMDLGGFLMFSRLKANIIPSLKPYLMDPASFESKLKYGQSIEPEYAGRLEKLLDDDRFKEFWELITLMLEKRMKVEQEAFLL
ncbi:MAG TPA: hypothetical protein GXX26_08660 [Clostridiaceae bacterium]|nr:hypothetical protein [Clostridiaceae bacterium]